MCLKRSEKVQGLYPWVGVEHDKSLETWQGALEHSSGIRPIWQRTWEKIPVVLLQFLQLR